MRHPDILYSVDDRVQLNFDDCHRLIKWNGRRGKVNWTTKLLYCVRIEGGHSWYLRDEDLLLVSRKATR